MRWHNIHNFKNLTKLLESYKTLVVSFDYITNIHFFNIPEWPVVTLSNQIMFLQWCSLKMWLLWTIMSTNTCNKTINRKCRGQRLLQNVNALFLFILLFLNYCYKKQLVYIVERSNFLVFHSFLNSYFFQFMLSSNWQVFLPHVLAKVYKYWFILNLLSWTG